MRFHYIFEDVMPIWMLSNTLPISINIISCLSFYGSTSFERVDKWNYEPRSNFNHKKHLSTLFACCFIFIFNLLRKYKNIFAFLFASYLHISTLFAITTIISTFILQSPPSPPLLLALLFSYLFCFFESLANLARTCDTLAERQGSLFFLLHVGSILTYSNLCYIEPVLK